jgi:hypothetical protein
MAALDILTKRTYQAGWIVLIIAALYRIVSESSLGMKLANLTSLQPRNMLQLSMMLFLICAASYAYAAVLAKEKEKKELPLKAKAHAA